MSDDTKRHDTAVKDRAPELPGTSDAGFKDPAPASTAGDDLSPVPYMQILILGMLLGVLVCECCHVGRYDKAKQAMVQETRQLELAIAREKGIQEGFGMVTQMIMERAGRTNTHVYFKENGEQVEKR